MYHDLLAAAALRINALTGVTGALMETAYTTRPLTTTQFQSAIFPFSSIKQALLNTEGKLAHTIASTAGHPWRASIQGITGTLVHKAPLPIVSAASASIIGEFGSVYDSADGTVCTEQPLEVIRRRVRNAGSFYRTPVYYFKIDDRRIYHTRTSVVIDCCVYNRTAQIAAISNDGALLLPDTLEEALICGTVSLLVRDDEFTGQAAIYRSYFNDTLAMIRGGLTTVPSKAKVSAPTT